MSPAERFNESSNYHAYLLRLSRPSAEEPWVIVAKDVETGEEHTFSSLAGLVEFLSEQARIVQ